MLQHPATLDDDDDYTASRPSTDVVTRYSCYKQRTVLTSVRRLSVACLQYIAVFTALCYARTMLSQYVRPSVRHTPYCAATAKHRPILKRFTPLGSHIILVFIYQT